MAAAPAVHMPAAPVTNIIVAVALPAAFKAPQMVCRLDRLSIQILSYLCPLPITISLRVMGWSLLDPG